jgi:diguanylate cyclase (GGDEF)-like protein/PAS domain S-box-containing protein
MMQPSTPPPPDKTHQKRVVIVVGSYVLLWLALWYVARIADVVGGASLWFLPAGLRYFTYVLFGWPALVLELAVVGIASFTQFITSEQPVPGLFSTAMGWLVLDWAGLPLAYALMLFPVRLKIRARLDFALAHHCALFIATAIATAIGGAMVGTSRLVLSGIIEPGQWSTVGASWFTGDFIGIVTLAPLLFVHAWPRLIRFCEKWRWSDSPNALPAAMGYRPGLSTAAVTMLSVVLVFGVPNYLGLTVQTPIVALLLLLPLVGVALRYGLGGAVLAVILLDSGVVLCVVLLQQQQLTLQYQLVMVAIALVGLWLGGAVESRNRLLENYNRELRAEVAQQTLDLQHANRDLAIKEQHLQVVLAAAPVGVLGFDSVGRCNYINNIAGVITGLSAAQAMGQHVLDFVHPSEREKMALAWNGYRQNSTVQTLETLLTNNLWCTAHWVHLPDAGPALDGAIVVLTDSTVRRQQEDRLWALGHHDSLTTLPNRTLFLDRCEQALSSAKRRGHGAAMLWLDLDGFKAVNDSLGHAAGDALLQQVAQRLTLRIRDSDTLARLGGDEFAVIMTEVNSADAVVQVANALGASLNEPFHLPQGLVQISCSIGVAMYPEDADSIERLMQRADMAMYGAKHSGKNRVQLTGSGPAERDVGKPLRAG